MVARLGVERWLRGVALMLGLGRRFTTAGECLPPSAALDRRVTSYHLSPIGRGPPWIGHGSIWAQGKWPSRCTDFRCKLALHLARGCNPCQPATRNFDPILASLFDTKSFPDNSLSLRIAACPHSNEASVRHLRRLHRRHSRPGLRWPPRISPDSNGYLYSRHCCRDTSQRISVVHGVL
jgi:hypothetical protein